MLGLGRQAGRFAVWWLVAFACWWAFVGEWALDELFWGVGLSALAAVAGVLVTAHGLMDGRSIGRSLRTLPSVARTVVLDFGEISVILARAIRDGRRATVGTFVRRPAQVAPHSPAVRSWMTVAATVSPNAYVIDVDPERGEVLMHDLSPRRSSERPA